MQAYSDADREDDPMALPDLEVFRASVIEHSRTWRYSGLPLSIARPAQRDTSMSRPGASQSRTSARPVARA